MSLDERLDHAFSAYFQQVDDKESLKEIAEKCGFSNYEEFLNEFQERYRKTPWEYRAEMIDATLRDMYGEGEYCCFESNIPY